MLINYFFVPSDYFTKYDRGNGFELVISKSKKTKKSNRKVFKRKKVFYNA